MRMFHLPKKAYHSLDNHHKINISESGQVVIPSDTRVRYQIVLDEKRMVWIYFKYTKERNEFRDFIKENRFHRCQVFPGYETISKFNVPKK